MSVVGLPTVSSYRGREVILDTNTLNAFTSYMQSLTFSFSYDAALGLVK
jgi:hypothetical protein